MPVSPGDRFCSNCECDLSSLAASPENGRSIAAVRPEGVSQSVAALQSGIAVTYCAPSALKVGFCSSIRFRIESAPDAVARMEIVLRNGQKEVARGICEMVSRECRLNVTPSIAGDLYLDVEIIIRHLGASEDEVYVSEFHVKVDDKPAERPVIVNNVKVDRIGAGWQGGFQLGQPSAGEGTDAGRYDCDSASPLPLTVVLRRSPHRLSLVSESCEMLMFSDWTVSFGRLSSQVDVQVPVFDASTGKVDGYLSNHVSGLHFSIGSENGQCVVHDGGRKPSTNGTSVDGSRLASGGTCPLSFGKDHHVSIMRAQMEDDVLVPFVLRVFDDGWMRKPSGCVVAREDGVATRVIMVWNVVGVELAKGVSVGWDGARFCIGQNGEVRPIAIGDTLEIDGIKWRVMPFHQRSSRNLSDKTNAERERNQK